MKREVEGQVTTVERHNGSVVASSQRSMSLGLAAIEGPPAEVGVTLGRTIALGNFEFVRIDVSLKVPCAADDATVDAMYDRAVAWAAARIQKEVDRVQAARPKPEDSVFG